MSIPYFSFYPTDFMHGVRGLTAQEVGVYTMLLCRIYEEDGPVEYHARRLATYCGMREAAFVKAVESLVDLGKLTLENGYLTNARAEAEIAKRAHGLKIASRAGKISAEKRQQNQGQSSTAVEQKVNHTDTDIYTDAYASDGDAVAAPEEDLTKAVFDTAVRYLGRHGTNERQARGIVGRWRKSHPDAAILSAITDCQRSGAVDPIPWITARLMPPRPFKIQFDLSKFEDQP